MKFTIELSNKDMERLLWTIEDKISVIEGSIETDDRRNLLMGHVPATSKAMQEKLQKPLAQWKRIVKALKRSKNK